MSKLSQEDYPKACNFTFDYFDKNKTGRITRPQFVEMLGAVSKNLNFPLTDAVIDNAFNSLDTQRQGWFSAQQLHGVLRNYYYS